MRKHLLLLGFTAIVVSLILGLRYNVAHAQQGQVVPAPSSIQSMDVCGDSISKAFNGQSTFPCPNQDQEQYNWATSVTHGEELCTAGPEGVYSQAERIECLKRANIIALSPNSAESGAQMLKDFVNQAQSVRARLALQPSPRYVPILLGHNDLCGGTVWKFSFGCERGSDQNPSNYCRTTMAAFERELRKGLDLLITLDDTHVGVASMVRVSQLCNHGAKVNCQTFTTCRNVWASAAYFGWIFGSNNGICGSLTANCSDTRIRDAYQTAKAYRDVLQRVAAEYAAIVPGATSRVVAVGGEIVGGAVKAPGVSIAYSDAPWRYKLTSASLNCCDCFHPSRQGQNVAARVLFEGLTCTATEPCCRDTGDPLVDGRCMVTDTDGRFYGGLF